MSSQLAVRDFFRTEAVTNRFIDILGERDAKSYISSVLIAVANNDTLQSCTPESILISAMRAATLGLSCDPGIGQAYLVPFKSRCTLIVGYKGLVQMATRTGKYRYLNVAKIYEGETVEEDRITGVCKLGGAKQSDKIIGWLLYFQLTNGFEKYFYMSNEEIHSHAKRYSKSYGREDSPWKTNTADMERKTPLRLGLSRWGYFDPADRAALEKVEKDDEVTAEVIEAEMSEVNAGLPAQTDYEKAVSRSESQILMELGY